ncbi:MAG: hypothetical protein ABH817_01150 [archaeon]
MRKLIRRKPAFCGWLECGEFVEPGEAVLVKKHPLSPSGKLWHTYHYDSPAKPWNTVDERVELVYRGELPKDILAYKRGLDLEELRKQRFAIPLERVAGRINPEDALAMYQTILDLMENLDDSSNTVNIANKEFSLSFSRFELETIAEHYLKKGGDPRDHIYGHGDLLSSRPFSPFEEIASSLGEKRAGKFYFALADALFGTETNRGMCGSEVWMLMEEYAREAGIELKITK